MFTDNIEYVSPGMVVVGKEEGLLISTPLGSCVAVCMYDDLKKTGGMAHVMLPGKTPDKSKFDEYKYAEDAINNLYEQLIFAGVKRKNLKVCLIGGANVLKKEGDTLVDDIINSVLKTIKNLKLPVIKTSLHGYERRSATIDLKTGNVFFTIGDRCSDILCKL
ncbi:MAG: chemotaxis protein CheD [Prolixibacteraceae bacterium]|nr:chemotaxis protein CheD [Prolixibacteraceae bacterium]